jgi:hypothetical protein
VALVCLFVTTVMYGVRIFRVVNIRSAECHQSPCPSEYATKKNGQAASVICSFDCYQYIKKVVVVS